MSPTAAPDPKLEKARELNRQGLLLLEAGDLERALSHFEDSRALFPSAKNTANVAICLDRLGRSDEALLVYEELLLKFKDGLDSEDSAAIAPAMAALRRRVGTLLVTSNSRGELFVDGRLRGVLPLKAGVRLNAGKHAIRIVQDGYAPFEAEASIEAERTAVMDADLEPLLGVGRLRVESPGQGDVVVTVDGEQVGNAPWEGTVAAGSHWVSTASPREGSAPAAVTVVEGQTVLLRPVLGALGPPTRVVVEPRTARLEIGKAAIPGGRWEGRLPTGTHTITVSEPGYVTKTRVVSAREGGGPIDLTLRLEVDPDHPRWPRSPGGTAWLGLSGSYAGGPTLGSDIEATCPEACNGDPWANGFALAARGGYRFPFGLSLELQGGFVWAGLETERATSDTFELSPDGRVQFALTDVLRVRGPLVAGGLSYRRTIVGPLAFDVRAAAGALFAFSSDPVTGTASTPIGSTGIIVSDRNETLTSAAPIVWPAATLELDVGPVDVGVGAGAILVLADGPRFQRSNFGATPDLDVSDPGDPGNSPLSDAVSNERAYSPFALFVPELRVSIEL